MYARHSRVFKFRKSNGKVLCQYSVRIHTVYTVLLTHSILRAPKSRRQLNARVTSFTWLNRSKRFEADKAPVHQTLRQWPRCPMVNNLVVINLATKRARGENTFVLPLSRRAFSVSTGSQRKPQIFIRRVRRLNISSKNVPVFELDFCRRDEKADVSVKHVLYVWHLTDGR